MANDIFKQWDQQTDLEGIQKDINDAEQGKGEFKEVPFGAYEVSVEKMELKASKKGDPMVSIWFKIVSDGEYKGSMIFYNQLVKEGFQIHNANEMLRALTKEIGTVIEFKSYSQYANLVMDVHEAIADSYEYALNYSQNSKGYSVFEITEVFPLDGEELPFN